MKNLRAKKLAKMESKKAAKRAAKLALTASRRPQSLYRESGHSPGASPA